MRVATFERCPGAKERGQAVEVALPVSELSAGGLEAPVENRLMAAHARPRRFWIRQAGASVAPLAFVLCEERAPSYRICGLRPIRGGIFRRSGGRG